LRSKNVKLSCKGYLSFTLGFFCYTQDNLIFLKYEILIKKRWLVCHSHANEWMLVASYGQCMLHRLIVKHCLLRWCWKHVDTIFLVIWCVCNVAQCLGLVDFFLLLPFLSLYFFVKVWRCHIIYFLYLIWSLFFYLFFINFVFQFSPIIIGFYWFLCKIDLFFSFILQHLIFLN
jgi:hypothetical protein